jgi:N-carbamoylputrescine amidase
MKITVCELPNSSRGLARDWPRLVHHVHQTKSGLVLLPEMPFSPWLAWRRTYNPDLWQAAVKTHEQWKPRMRELAPAVVCGTFPITRKGRRLNVGFVHSVLRGFEPVHSKYYLPQEPGFWESSWYERGAGTFEPHRISGISLGFLICTELWFFQHARSYGQGGVHAILCPRATPNATLSKWVTGGRAASVVAGAFCLSSNRISESNERADLGGQGWITDPEGEVLGKTSRKKPFLTLDVDMGKAERAKRSYPRYVTE